MSRIKRVPVDKAIGYLLIHDITIISKNKKGVLFKKGHIIREEDIPSLKKVGKRFVYVVKDKSIFEEYVHEDDFSEALATASVDETLYISGPSEGKFSVYAKVPGILKVNDRALNKLNMIYGVKFSTRLTNSVLFKDELAAIVGLGPLFTSKRSLEKALRIAKENYPILRIKAFSHDAKVGLIVTGNEIYEGLIKDEFTDVLKSKLKKFNIEIYRREVLPDNKDKIRDKILDFIQDGCNIIIVSGGMSVDPDDVTPLAIRSTGAKVVFYGAPIFPGSSIMLAYYGDIPIYGTTASPIFYDKTTLDLFLPRFIAKDRITRKEVAAMGHGGLLIEALKKKH